MKLAIVSGYFAPLLPHHLDYIEGAQQLCEDVNDPECQRDDPYVIVIVNNDKQVELKESIPFLCQDERFEIMEALKHVRYAQVAFDKDLSVVRTIQHIREHHLGVDLVFCNGGDRTKGNNRPVEEIYCEEHGIEVVYGVGGAEKTGSSSDVLDRVGREWFKRYNDAMGAALYTGDLWEPLGKDSKILFGHGTDVCCSG